MQYRLTQLFLACLVILLTTDQTSCQYLSVPDNGVDVGEHFTMKCHFGDSVTDQDVLFINWYHSSISTQNRLYTHNIGQTGETKTEWETRHVTGVYTESYHEVTVQTAIQEDQKLYICEYLTDQGWQENAKKQLEVHVAPLKENTIIQATGDIVEGYECKFVCEVNNIRPVDKLKIDWKIGANGQEIKSNSTTDEENGDGLFLINAELSYMFVEENDGQQMFCIVYWDGSLQYDVSQELDVLYPPFKATPVKDEVVSEINKTTTLECIVETGDAGNPDIYMFTWTRKRDASFNAKNNGTLILIPSSEDYNDVYSCVPENTVGTGIPGEIQLLLKEAPVISSLIQLENSTSTVISLSFYLNSTGGSISLTLSLWYQDISANHSESIHDVPISANNADTIYINVEELVPNTTYKLILRICDADDASLFSNNITETGTTTASPVIHLNSGKLEHDQLTAQWDYISVQGQVKVTICMEYWTTNAGKDTSKLHPSTGLCDIPVENRMLSVLGDFVIDETYEIYLHVSENGFSGTTSGQQWIDISNQSSGMPSGEIAAITVSVLFSILLVVFIILLFLGIINIKPVYNCRENGRDTNKADSEQTNRTYETPAKPSKIYVNQHIDDRTYEQLKGRHSTTMRDSQIELNITQEDTQGIYMEPQMDSC